MWANCSVRSPKMSDHERFAQVARRKWAIVSELLRSLTKNERMSQSVVFLSESLIHSFLGKKRAIRSENWWAKSQPCFLVSVFFYKLPILRKCTLLQNNLCEDQLYYQNLNYQKVGEWQINCHGNVDESIRTVRQSTTICKLSMNLYKKSLLNLSCKWPWKFRFCNSPLQFKTILINVLVNTYLNWFLFLMRTGAWGDFF